MISSSRVCESSQRSRAAGFSRIAGYLPFISQARNRNVQSTIARSSFRSAVTARIPVNVGVGISEKSTFSAFTRAWVSESRGLARRLACASRRRSCSVRVSATNPSCCSGLSRAEATPTTREASSTCTVAPS